MVWRLTGWAKVQEEIKAPKSMKSKKAGAGAHQPGVSKCHSLTVWLGRVVPVPTQGNSRSLVAGKSGSCNKVTICSCTLSSERGLKPQSQAREHQLGAGDWAQEKALFLLLTSFPGERKVPPKTNWPFELSNQLKPVFCKNSVSHYKYWSFSYIFYWLSRSPRQFTCFKC